MPVLLSSIVSFGKGFYYTELGMASGDMPSEFVAHKIPIRFHQTSRARGDVPQLLLALASRRDHPGGQESAVPTRRHAALLRGASQLTPFESVVDNVAWPVPRRGLISWNWTQSESSASAWTEGVAADGSSFDAAWTLARRKWKRRLETTSRPSRETIHN
jgi:hypothetical protein